MRRRTRRRDTDERLRKEHVRASPPQTCEHLAEAADGDEPAPLTPGRCGECSEHGGDTWAHLRMCLTCGHVGCCDSSPHQHANAHFHQTGHPVMRSVEPGESWRWCYVDIRLG
ncbi:MULTISPECIES: UBP-type zinc finger domain-containing protein [unclassified Mycobacterium]|uniref:UBP-type zinc finger domain-containing protein n=1 Tax=unclassified Mycobacterium TaxID=2642494 RepID=UPI0029C9269B|nr:MULTISPECIES: UBP-type zinc finger domain-containing protein [unclassified Mycobacterium]